MICVYNICEYVICIYKTLTKIINVLKNNYCE